VPIFDTEHVQIGRTKDGVSEAVPAWQQGTAQTAPDDYALFATEGYTQGSLVYSCITYQMQSIASLGPAIVERPGESGFERVPDHPLTQLLASPAEFMDADEFMRELVMHLLVSGNAYIEKIRTPRTDGLRFAGSVQSLGLLRPDYVEIVPGQTRADDVFKVTIAGVERAKLPRADVIHIKLPHPTNDFYGLSPIALITREGSIDLHMSDFELAFFRNAGVPYGVLFTQRNFTPQQKEDAKASFRRAFQGFRNWFDLLVLNAQDAEYKQLALANSDMEMGDTRDLVETRICAVLGVPAVIAGALVGLKNSPWSEMKTAYRKYWSDSAQPLSKMIAAPLRRELLTEMATTADGTARVVFDFSGVEALREDRTDKLNAVATLINTGGVTVGFAFESVGLTPPEDSDFVVPKTGSATTVPGADTTGARGLLPTARKDALDDAAGDRAGMLQEVTDQLATLADAFEPVVADLLAAQGARVVERMRTAAEVQRSIAGGGTLKVHEQLDPDLLVTQADLEVMVGSFGDWHERAVRAGWDVGGAALGDGAAFSLTEQNIDRALERSGELIQGINDETRAGVQRTLQTAHDRGYTIDEIARGVPEEDFPGLAQSHSFSKGRARTIARTEMANAQGQGASARYRAAEDAGVSVLIRVADGDGCGWLSHDDPEKADGMLVTISEFEDHVIAHPNCVRAPIPEVQE